MSFRAMFEHATDSAGLVRGVVVGDGDRGHILFVHDFGADLDEFGRLPELLAALGYVCTSIDLPGHGLSDGDEVDIVTCARVALDVIRAASHRAGVVGVVASGRMATVGTLLGHPDGVRAQVLCRPVLDDEVAALGERSASVRMVMHGEGTSLAGTVTQGFFSPLIGQKLLVSNVAIAEGAAAVARSSTLTSHVELFFHRYLAPETRSFAS